MNLEQLRKKYVDEGYTIANASAKICQDIILNKISKSSMNQNVTIKGGVVMHGISNDKRRATRDLDMDFIRYSLSDEAIINFIETLNDNEIKIRIEGVITELHHEDYNGKRVNVELTDVNNFSISAKLDIGVHKNINIKQEEYCFQLDAINDCATLMINSKEQILVEKLKSLLKFGITSTRFKDVFDFYYLINNTDLNKEEVIKIMNVLIINDTEMRENSVRDVIRDLRIVLQNKQYKSRLADARNNWLELPVEVVTDSVIEYFEKLENVLV